MKLDFTYVDAFLQDCLSETSIQDYVQHYQTPDPKRKDVVVELKKQLEIIVDEFPHFNHDLWHELFQDQVSLLDRITILPVVGEQKVYSRTIKEENHYIIVLDLHLIANFTPIISQMVYILQNHLTCEITKLVIADRYPLTEKTYMSLLDHMTFTHGLANWLAWNQNCKDYKFYTEQYEKHKEEAFGMLAQAMSLEDKSVQFRLIQSVLNRDLWEQFPTIAGLFFFDDVFREVGKEGIFYLYKHGPTNFISLIFHS